jgi:D-beta-D-heptose 7-phosphate kinase/D-beta-D-heptose 1-phosphate adenosyltransferase
MKKIFVNGTFDIVHTGHLLLLNYARSLGDHLLVAIDSDSRVQRLKGQSRPINDESERTSLLINLRSVDRVRIFETDEDLVNIIATYQPDIMVKGSDYKNQPIIGAEHCKEIAFFERINEYSTTKKIQYIIDRR